MYIAATGLAGYGGARLLCALEGPGAVLRGKYPAGFLKAQPEAENEALLSLFNKQEEKGLAAGCANGGFLKALWALLKQNGLGGYYSLSAVPVLQQTVEICETFNINPYALHAPGCRLWLLDEASLPAVAEAAVRGRTPMALIGRTAKGPAIIRTDCETRASLRRPVPDELLKFMEAPFPEV